jgi:hypothetical protein
MWISLCRTRGREAQVPDLFRLMVKLAKKYPNSDQFFYIQLLTRRSGDCMEVLNVNIARPVMLSVRKSLI